MYFIYTMYMYTYIMTKYYNTRMKKRIFKIFILNKRISKDHTSPKPNIKQVHKQHKSIKSKQGSYRLKKKK